ncbi:MAG: translation initiation factor IF-1 [Planctomycetota bacterium]|jgi:translation initiation factor IF-1
MTGQGQPSNSDAAGSDTQRERARPEATLQGAKVLESLNNGLFRLQMNDGRPVVAHVAKDLRMALSRLLPGDPVLVDVSPFDPGKARICKLLAQ